MLLIVTGLAVLALACGEAGPINSPAPVSTQSLTGAVTSTPATTTTPMPHAGTTPPDVAKAIDTYRDEYVITTDAGEIVGLGEHSRDASRWVQTYGSDSALVIETVAIGDEVWERLGGDDWSVLDEPVDAALFEHPFTPEDVLAGFWPDGRGEHEGFGVDLYRLEGPDVADYLELNPDVYRTGTITVALLDSNFFASYTIELNASDEQWTRLTYRIYDIGAEVIIARPEVVTDVLSCRDPFTQLIDEVGSFKSRYDLLHSGAAFSSIEELRLEEPWAWQQTVRFRNADASIDTLWVDGGFRYWREPGGEWQEDLDGSYQAMTYRPFVDDLWLPDLVASFVPTGTDTVNGRSVDVYELDLDDLRILNEGSVRNTDTLEATFWVEPCSHPALLELEVIATGRGYADGEFHVVYEVYDFGTTDTIDIPAEALED